MSRSSPQNSVPPNSSSRQRGERRLAGWVMQGVRVGMLVVLVLIIHDRHRQLHPPRHADSAFVPEWSETAPLFPTGTGFDEPGRFTDDAETELVVVVDAEGRPLGFAVETSPVGDRFVGFSGPTNLLIGVDDDGELRGIRIRSSQDTIEHVEQIERDSRFLAAFEGISIEEPERIAEVEAVSGATLTSRAIQQAVIARLSMLGGQPIDPDRLSSLKFPDPPAVEEIASLFEGANTLEATDDPMRWRVVGNDGSEPGTVLRTAKAAETIIGYQGPTDTLIGFDTSGEVVGIRIGRSYDNEPYVGYVREDEWGFLTLFDGMTIDDLKSLDVGESGIEGVSGATMTSQAVARGITEAAQQRLERKADSEPDSVEDAASSSPAVPGFKPDRRPDASDWGTAVVLVLAMIIGFTRLRGNRWVRVVFLIMLVGYLGFINGDLLSQAMFVGWAKHGLPSRGAFGLLLLTVAAVVLPVTTKRNLYCSHLCPHGAAQQLLKNRGRWRLRLPRKLLPVLKSIPVLVLGLVLLTALWPLELSLVAIEPFDAYLLPIAGGAAMTIAVIGLIASLFIPMAYCRFGCPTGTLLDYLRRHGRSDEWSRADSVAFGCVMLAITLWTGWPL